jgi:hypothetical protein
VSPAILPPVTAPTAPHDWRTRNGDGWSPTPGEHADQLVAAAGARLARYFEGRPDLRELRAARAALDEAIADG